MRGELERGTKRGKYEIHGRLSVGGMAELYLASLAGPGGFRKFVAIKRVLPSIAEDGAFLQMFLDEARITATLSHSAIAQVYELAEDPESREPLLAMEFVAGQNLEQLVSRARKRTLALPPAFTLRVAHDVLMGLHYAHGFVEPATGKPMPVIHRDINPRNVMVTYTGGTKLIDFGIAKARGRLNQTQVGYVKGTLQYMAPEQITAKEITGRTDLFAASIVFYELLSGRRLFGEEGSDAATMTRIVSGEVPHLARVAPALPEEVASAVMKGLEKDPARRWRNGREYARALERALPETWDDQQMGELMARLFDDKIALTRGLLSSSVQANEQDLRLMSMMGEEEGPTPPPEPEPPHDEVPTSPGHAAPKRGPVGTDRTEQALEPIAPAAKSGDAARPARTATPEARAVPPPAPTRSGDANRVPRAPTSDATRAGLSPAASKVDADVTQASLPPTRKRTEEEVMPQTPPPRQHPAEDEEVVTETPPPRRRTQGVATRGRSRADGPVATTERPPFGLYALAVALALVLLAALLSLLG